MRAPIAHTMAAVSWPCGTDQVMSLRTITSPASSCRDMSGQHLLQVALHNLLPAGLASQGGSSVDQAAELRPAEALRLKS